MRTILRAAAVATAAVAAIAGTAGAANAAPRNHVSLHAPHSVKANKFFELTGSGYDSRTRSGFLCLAGREKVNGHWSSWGWLNCEAHRSGHKLSYTGYANHGFPAGEYEFRLGLVTISHTNHVRVLDWSSLHVMWAR